MAGKTHVEAPESVVETIEPEVAPVTPNVVPAGFVEVLDGDNWQTIAERVGKDPAALAEKNAWVRLYPGMKVCVE